MWAQIFTAYYFAFFLLILPLLGIMETPKPMPRSIAEAVLKPRPPSDPAPSAVPAE
jgi:ubiquinol-cytochrome c reductase cytochrome b subunit